MSLRLCSIKHANRMAPVDRDELASAADAYVERGMDRQAAEEQAILDKLDELNEVKARIEKEALAEFERKMPARFNKIKAGIQDNKEPIKNESRAVAGLEQSDTPRNQEYAKERAARKAKEDSAKADEFAETLRRNAKANQGAYKGKPLKDVALDIANAAIDTGRRLSDSEIEALSKKHDVPSSVIKNLATSPVGYEYILARAEGKDAGALALKQRQYEQSQNNEPQPSAGVSVSGPQESKSKNYGAKNKLVSSDRAAELREKLKAKLNNLNSGIDPETLAIGTELAVYHIEAGTRSFVEFARAMAGDLGTTIDKIRPYLRSWYNGARDMMEDSGHNVDGMSSPDEVRESLKTLSDKKEGAKPENAGRLADYLLPRLSEITGNTALRKAVKEFSGARELQDVTPEMMKMAQEHLEMALVMNAREIVASAKSDKEAFDKLLASYENQPLLNVRSSTSMENQAYSTPAPLAFLAGRLAGINSDGTVYEPTAGNGMLLIGAAPENAYANELDGNRAVHLKYLGFKTTEKDGSEYLPKGKMDSAIMNPPFGNLDKFGKPSAVQYDGYTVKKIDHLITMKALESIKDDGRASIIIGANKEAGVIGNGAERVFLNWLYSHYNVVDHFEVNGDLYRRQGAGWPVRVITVNGRLESKEFAPKSGSIPRFDNWNDIYEHSKQVLDSERFRAERHRENVSEYEPQTGNNVGSNAANAIENSTPDGRSGSGARGERAGVARDGRKLPKSDNGNGKPASNSGNASEGGHDNQHGNQLTPKSDAGERQSEQLGLDRVGGRSDVSPTDGSGGSNRKPVLGGGASEFQAEYKAASNGFNDSVLTPKNMADATKSALDHIESEVGNIDDYVAGKLEYKSTEEMHEGLMALQVDTVAAAIYNVEKRGKGIIIADQTGVGKGRQAAALIRYAILNGMTPIFVTVKPNLYSDMYGDLLDIGSKNAKPFVTNADTGIEHNGETLFNGKGKAHKDKIQSIIDNGALPAGHDMLFTTYDQLKGDSNNLRRAAISAIQKPFFILDEAHNAAGEMYSEKKVNGVKAKVTTTAGFVYESLKDKPVVYLSATYAKRPDNMPIYYRTDLLDAVDTPQELVDAVNAGGVPLQQVVASMLASNGQLFRRERSFAGIKMNFQKDSSNVSEQERISDEVNKGLRAVVEASGAFAEWYEQNHREIEPPGGSTKLAGNKADSMAGSVNPFTSVVHNYIRQLLLGIKAEKAATKAIELFKSGKKPVIALENTMGSFLAEYVEKNKLKVGDPINFNYNDILKVALERTRRVSFKNDKGDSVPLPIELHQLDPMTRLIYSQAEEEINDIDLSALPASPIDFMLNEMRKAGMSLGEITGRGYFVDYSGAVPVLGMRTKKEKDDRRKTVDSFNNGKIDALILNSAGSTGLSIHASERFKDQSPRHMIIAQPMLDINTLMQMLGRINRTGQVELPEFTFLSLDLPAEIRPTATTKAKMAKLNANTSANDKSDTSFESPDFMNKYGDQVVNEFLQDNPDIEVATGTYSGESAPEDMALKFTGRLALLDAKIQRRVMAEILEAYSEKIEYLNKTGQNDLVAQDLKLDAYIQDSKIVHEGKDPESVFGGHTTLHKVNVKYLGKPPTADDVASAIDDALDGETPEKAMSQIIHGKDSDEKYLRDLEGRYKEAAADREKKLADAAAHEKAGGTSDADDKKRNKLQNSLTSAESRLNTAKEAISAYHANRDNMRDTLSRVLKIGNRVRVDVGDENVNAVIVGIKDTHKAGSGNPWAPSKVRITMMVNSGIRQISVNYKQLMGKDGLFVESLRGSGKVGLADVFKKDFDENRREIRYIATGNLIAGSAKMDGGKITSFTDSDGTTHQGILMPRKYGKKGEYEQGNSVSSVVVRDASVLAKYLNLGGQFSEIGAFSPDKAIKVSSGRDGGLVISVPIANKNKVAFTIKLDDNLRKIVGDFYGSSKTQTAKIPAGKERAALTRLMELTPLSIPAKMRDSLVAVGGDEAPDAVHSFDGKTVQTKKAPDGKIVEQESAAPFQAEGGQSSSNDTDDKPNGKIIAGKFHSNAPEKIYTTKKGKDISGVIAYGVSLDDVKSEVDQYAWKMDGGVFIRMAHVERPAGDIKYSLSNQEKQFIPIAESQAVIDKLKSTWKGAADIRLVDSLDGLPSDVRNSLVRDGKTLDNVQGIFHPKTGIIYLNANKITSAKHAKELVFHEAYTHLGLSNLFGKDVTAIMGRLYLAMGGQKGVNDLAAKHDIDLSKYEALYAGEPAEYRNAIIAEELLAHLSEHPQPKLVQLAKELIGAIRAWLRKNGFAELAEVTDSDIALLLKQSRETITKSKAGDVTGLIYTLAGMSKAERKELNAEAHRYSLDDLPEKSRKIIEGKGLLELWGLLAQSNEAFSLPVSEKRMLERIFVDLEGENGIAIERADELAMQYGYDELHEDVVSWRLTAPNGEKAAVFQVGSSVWVDLSALNKGGYGQRIYNAVANYAHNTGRTFQGDPQGLSDVARSRRLENMLSSALKFGTTNHLFPHPKQAKSNKKIGVHGIKWKDGDDAHNLAEMINASYQTTLNQFPEIENMVYNSEKDEFQYRDSGEEVTKDDLDKLASRKREESAKGKSSGVGENASRNSAPAKITAGRTTLERAVLTGSFLRGTSSERSQLLERLGKQHSKRLEKILYSLDSGSNETNETRSQGGFSVSGLQENKNTFGISVDGILRVWQDKMRPLLRTQEAIKKDGGRISENENAYLAEEAFHGKTENDLRKMRERYLEPMSKKMADSGIEREELDMYLWAKHAEERNAQIARINPDMPDGGSGMTNEQAKKLLKQAETEGKKAQLESLANTVYALLAEKRKIARYLAGDEVVDSWTNAYQFYVPLKGRAVDDSSASFPRVGRGFDIRGGETMRALGRRTKPESPTLHAIKDTTESIIRYRKNEVGNAFLALVEANPNPEYWEAHDASNPDFERKLLKKAGKEYVGQAKVINKEDYFITKRDGKEYYIRLEDPLLMRALKNMGPEKMNWAMQHLAKASRFLSAMCTSYNPEFVITNFARDIQTAIINLQAEIDLHDGKVKGKQITGKMIKGVPFAMRSVYASLKGKRLTGDLSEWQKYFDDFRNDGANTGWFQLQDIDQQAADLETLINSQKKNAVGFALRLKKKIGDFVANGNGAVESAIRLSVYKSAIEAGVSRKQAASLAKNLTVNFNRKGEIGASMNAAYMFFNAAVQGTASLARALGTLKIDADGKRSLNMAQKVALGVMVAAFGLAALNRSAAGEDDDEENWWDKVPAYEKERNIIIMKSVLGGPKDGTYWKIPLPYGYNIFNAVSVSTEGAVNGKKGIGEASGEILKSMLGAFSPIGIAHSETFAGGATRTLAPTVLKPLADLTANENFFGTRIFAENMEFDTPKPDSHLAMRSTNVVWKWIAESLNDNTGGSAHRSGLIDISPDKMGYVFNYFVGSAGAFYSTAVHDGIKLAEDREVKTKEIPFVRKLSGSVDWHKDQNVFYERKDEIGQIREEYKALDAGQEREQFKAKHSAELAMSSIEKVTSKKLSSIRKKINAIKDDEDLTDKQKDELIEPLDLRMKAAVNHFNKLYREKTEKAKH